VEMGTVLEESIVPICISTDAQVVPIDEGRRAKAAGCNGKSRIKPFSLHPAVLLSLFGDGAGPSARVW
jgi:hypothetical protein